MKKLICDLCSKTEKYCQYTIRKKWSFFRFDYDSQGGCNFELDICDTCFDRTKKEAMK